MRKVLYIFGLLTDADVAWMARTGNRRWLDDGEVVIREGGDTNFLIFLLEGEVFVSAEGFGEVARMGVGEIVGEISLVDSAPPAATIMARGRCRALFLDKARLLRKMDDDEGFGSRFYRALAVFLADRLRGTRKPEQAGIADVTAILKDELDEGILDRISDAGERFQRMLKVLSGAAP